MTSKWVYLFSDLDETEAHTGSWEGVRGLLGGKGANLADMTRLGVPVPPGLVITTEACNAYLAAGERFPESLWEQVVDALAAIERETGKGFGAPDHPLLVSCRSGAKQSMPGMMDTILNIGLNDEVAGGLSALTGNPRFVWDAYRRLIQMFGAVVLGVPDEVFEQVITAQRERAGARTDAELGAGDWEQVSHRFKELVRAHSGQTFPAAPLDQLRLATEAVFRSWNGKRAVAYRNASGIRHDLGTAVNIQAMVFGNMGDDSATGVTMSRNASTGEPALEGDYLINAQGEDVVAGIRQTRPIAELADQMPAMYQELAAIARKLETHYRDMQDMEFTIERGKLWILQTRDGKRTAQAAVRIAADMVEEGLISPEQAVRRIQPAQVEFFLHPQLDPRAREQARRIATGLDVSPGAAVGAVVFDADTAVRWAEDEGRPVIMVRPDTKPDDVHGMLAAAGVVTSHGGRTSHAALVARQFGKPAVVGASEIHIDLEAREMRIGDDLVIKEGAPISIDGTLGEIYEGELATVVPDVSDPYLTRLLAWADEIRTMGVRANTDYPRDAERARAYGAEGLGLVRTEHMFFETERLPLVQGMIMARSETERAAYLAKLLPLQRSDFAGLFRTMSGLPVVIRLIDPPLHEFLPAYDELVSELADLKLRLQHAPDMTTLDSLLDAIQTKQRFLERVASLREANPMLGTRGVRVGILIPELTQMQVRAIFEAACQCQQEGIEVQPEVMIPLTAHINELRVQQQALEEVARQVMAARHVEVAYSFGTMIEVPRAALTADELAGMARFFSFGTNDLTQTTLGISRDDAESGFLLAYARRGILPDNPFATIDENGVGKLMRMAVELGRATRPDLEVGICGEHGGDPRSIDFCQRIGVDYVSCSPYRVPIARLAAAHATLRHRSSGNEG